MKKTTKIHKSNKLLLTISSHLNNNIDSRIFLMSDMMNRDGLILKIVPYKQLIIRR